MFLVLYVMKKNMNQIVCITQITIYLTIYFRRSGDQTPCTAPPTCTVGPLRLLPSSAVFLVHAEGVDGMECVVLSTCPVKGVDGLECVASSACPGVWRVRVPAVRKTGPGT